MAEKRILHSIDLAQAGAIIAGKFEVLASDPTSPVEAQEWFNSTDSLRKVVANGIVEEYAFRSWVIQQINLLGRSQGSFDASTSSLPTITDKVAGDLAALQAGDYWFISNGGTIANIVGDDVLSLGDKIQFTGGDPTDATNWIGVQTNINDSILGDTFSDRILVSMAANTPTTITSTIISDIHSTEAYLGGEKVGVCINEAATPNARIVETSIAVTSLAIHITGKRTA